MNYLRSSCLISLLVLFLLAGCRGPEPAPVYEEAPTLRVVATTTIIGDIARQVGSTMIDLTVLLPAGSDPHTFNPSPQDARAIADADILLLNGIGLDNFVLDFIPETDSAPLVVDLSEGIVLRYLEDVSGPAEADPHVWMDPNNVLVWVEHIAAVFAGKDSRHAGAYDANAASTIRLLLELDSWIEEQVGGLNAEKRRLVTDHDSLGYFAGRYGFDLVGFIIPGFSTLSQPSAGEMADLVDRIRSLGVPAVFIDSAFDPGIAVSLAEDTGVEIVRLYAGALGEPGGPASSYDAMMRTNVEAIVAALAGE